MSILNEYLVEEQKNHAHADSAAGVKISTRSVFTHQTGQALVALGTVFKFIPPFNNHIDKQTGQMLISIGRKLKAAK